MSLTETARNFKLGVKLLGVVAGIAIFFRVLVLLYGLTLPQIEIPEEQAAATVKYGPIPPLILDRASIVLPPNFSTTLDLIQSELPSTPIVANVYPLLKAPYGFLSEDRAVQIAGTFQFTQPPIKVSPVESLWNAPNVSFIINDQTLNFSYSYNYAADPTVFVPGTFGSQQDLVKRAMQTLAKHLVITTDEAKYGGSIFVLENPPVFLVKYEGGILQPTQRLLEASAARIDFKRRNVNYELSNKTKQDFPFVSNHFVGALTYVMLGISDQPDPRNPNKIVKPELLDLKRTAWLYDPGQGSTYPIITSRDAWENVQRDPSLFTVYVGNLKLGPLDAIQDPPSIQGFTAKEAYLGYFDTEKEQDYLQPVWVFVGKASLAQGGELDWVAYVPAVHPRYIKSVAPTTAP